MRGLAIVVGVAIASACSSSTPASDQPVSGTFHGSTFQLVGGRTENVDSFIDIELVNFASDCSRAIILADGQMDATISMPRSMLAPGTFNIGSNVTFGITKVINAPKFEGFGGGDGTVVIKAVGASIEGSISVKADGLSLSGTFNVPFCSTSDAGSDGPSESGLNGG